MRCRRLTFDEEHTPAKMHIKLDAQRPKAPVADAPGAPDAGVGEGNERTEFNALYYSVHGLSLIREGCWPPLALFRGPSAHLRGPLLVCWPSLAVL